VGCPAIEEPCTNRTVPFVAWPEGGAFCHRKSLTSPFFVQCSTPLMRVLVSMALRSSGKAATYCTHILCKNPPRLRKRRPHASRNVGHVSEAAHAPRRHARRPPCDPREGSRHLADLDLAALRGRSAGARVRPACRGAAARQPCRAGERQPAAAVRG